MDSKGQIAGLRARIAELESEQAAMEGFAAMAAHELLTPVVMMDACAATVSERLNGNGHDESLRDLEALRRAASRSRLLVETMLHHARVHDLPLERGPVELGKLVGDCVALLGPELRRRETQIDSAPLPTVDADEPLLHAVYMNLLVNALKYGPRSGAVIHLDADSEPGAWRLAVESEGEPVPAEDRERIFQPYRRGSGERRARGSGLGLSICRDIVVRHGGEIGVAPGDGGGNRFFFTLPQK
jgi:signal transduction histidine kinase